MGPVAAIFALAALAALVWFTVDLWVIDAKDLESAAELWFVRIASALLTMALGVAMVDAYIVDVHMPFAPREADLPAHSDPPEHTPDLALPVDTEPTKPAASADHRAGLRQWEADHGR